MRDYTAELYKDICKSSYCDGLLCLLEPEYKDEELNQMN